jgi:hypothetical protein
MWYHSNEVINRTAEGVFTLKGMTVNNMWHYKTLDQFTIQILFLKIHSHFSFNETMLQAYTSVLMVYKDILAHISGSYITTSHSADSVTLGCLAGRHEFMYVHVFPYQLSQWVSLSFKSFWMSNRSNKHKLREFQWRIQKSFPFCVRVMCDRS